MTYQDKVSVSKTIINAINGLGNEDQIRVIYGTDYNGEPQGYKIKCHIYRDGKPSYSIHKDEVFAISGMNIDKISKTTMRGYTYDMMGQRTTYTFPLYDMVLDTNYDDIKY